MSKMTSHEPFGHLKHKLWSKEGPGVKLAVWLSTTKSRESTRPRCAQVECNTLLKSSWGELQVCFRPHPNRRSELGVMNSQCPGSPNWDNFLASPETKSHSDVGPMGKRIEYYMGQGGGFPRVHAVVSQVNPCCPWFVPTPRLLSNVNESTC
jgi:hypothetical protein